MFLSQTRRRLTLLPLVTSTRISDAPCNFYLSFNGQGCPNHQVPSSHVWQRMMCLKPLEVTLPTLALHCTSSCKGSNHITRLRNDGSRSTNSLQEGLLIKGRWWLIVAPSTTSASSSSTCHLKMSNCKLRFLFLSNY